jgi:hypothetical protein
MNPQNFSHDFTLAAMEAWNTLTILMENDEKTFTDPAEFESFYSVVMDQLHEEDSKE